MSQDAKDKEREEVAQEPQIKVTDRRLFAMDGSLRQSLEDAEADADAARPVPEEKKPGRAVGGPGAFERRPLDEPEGVDFTMLINAMAQPALIFLGEIPHPGTGRPELNLEQARLQIDLLDTLRIKCRGNLTTEEESLLDRMLYQLRMLFVTRSSAGGP